ncbi:MAG: chitobiase/beta-hexosaminidase C-terminal domain-containing protein, partial [Syntrophaceae bacterium]|nr:chitobiase/beta-hexosaminidase C-terminal domain-containing protein [Syntrophaceae bacterium]
VSSLLDLCFNNGVDMMSFFSNVESNAYGLLEYQDQPVEEAPKYQTAYNYAAEMNISPEIAVTSPEIPVHANGDALEIKWVDTDPDSNANVSLYYDDDNSGQDGMPIVSGLKEDPDGAGDTYSWDISNMSEGVYFIYAVIQDPYGSVYAYAPEEVYIDRTAPAVSATPGAGLYDISQTVTLSSDENADIYYTMDGTNPDIGSLFYSGPIEITENTILKFMAIDLAGNESPVSTAAFDIGPQDITLQVLTDAGSALSGLNVYVFSESGAYTGKTAKTDASGKAAFSPSLFSTGNYKFRADYLGRQFWSNIISLPVSLHSQMIIPMEIARISVAMAGEPIAGIKVYLFSESGSYLGLNQSTGDDGLVSFELPEEIGFKFRADVLGSQYWSEPMLIQDSDTNDIDLDTGGGLFHLTLQKDPDTPIQGVKLYLFNSSGSYLGLYQVSDAWGQVTFNVSEGTYKVRADHMGYQFWSDPMEVTTDTAIDFTLPHTEVAITVNAVYQGASVPVSGVKVYLFNTAESYLGISSTTNAYGQVFFSVPDRAYKVRSDYLGRQYWSEEFTGQDTDINLPMAEAWVTVTGCGLPQQGVKIYLFTLSGSYLGLYKTTDASGQVSFRIPEGSYKFRADYQGKQFWSAESALAPDMINPVAVPVGGGSFTLTVTGGNNIPLAGVNCYVFSQSGSYLGMSGATNTNGQVFFNLANGSYVFRVDYLGQQFWSNTVTVPDALNSRLNISHETAEITVVTGTGPVAGVKVYLFSESGAYLGRYCTTDDTGTATFELPVGVVFKFRADVLGSQYWSTTTEIESGGINPVAVDAGGGLFQITVQKAPGSPMAGVKLYLFSETGSYLGQYRVTGDDGIAVFEVPTAVYKARVDYLGYQFWTEATEIQADTVITFSIPHQQVEATVNSLYQTETNPLSGIKTYLFNEAGSYMGQYQITNTDGRAIFSLPEKAYKLRADYLGAQFWTEAFTWEGVALNIPYGTVSISVRQSGSNVEGAKVYLFTESGSYLGLYNTTSAAGTVDFRIPAGQPYQFRVDHDGRQVWSQVMILPEGGNEIITVDLSE